jgi:hypothetical protein
MTLVLRILSAKFPYLMELFYSVIVRKFSFFESDDGFKQYKDPRVKADDYSFYKALGFDPNLEIEKKPAKVIAHYSKKEVIDSYVNRLECYSTLLYGVLSCDLRIQLRDFPNFARKYRLWEENCLDYEYMYYYSIQNILKFAPVQI